MPAIKGPRKVHRYSNEFKVKAVQLAALPGVLTQDVARALDIHPLMLSRWKKEVREGTRVAKRGERIQIDHEAAAERKRLRALERENAILKEELTLLKKPSGSVPNERRSFRVHRAEPGRACGAGDVPALWRLG